MNASEQRALGLSLFLAPLFFFLSSFFWVGDGQYGVTGGTLLIFGSLFWIVAFVGIFGVLREKTPRYAAWGLLFAIYGAVCGGIAFAFQGFFMELYGVSHDVALGALGTHPLVANLIFWIGGPAFPLTLLILGIVLVRTKTVPAWVGTLLALGGMLFPVARIPRIDLVAHAVDVLMLVPAWYMGQSVLRRKRLA
jgi:hypothetical protein